MNESDLLRLNHMLEAAREAVAFATGETRAKLENDRKLALALIKEIEIIGEAASKLSQEFQDAHPHIPWHAIIGMRNRLVHGYFEIDLDRLWDTVTQNVPLLIEQVEGILSQDSEE